MKISNPSRNILGKIFFLIEVEFQNGALNQYGILETITEIGFWFLIQ